MRLISLAVLAALAAGCAAEKPAVQSAPPPIELTRNDCYTVVLFDDVEIIEPSGSVPAERRAFLGHWQKGAWDGKWCHDILISAIHDDGSADVFDMHAPYDDWGQPATAFRRKARFDDKNALRFRHGNENRLYTVVDGRLHAKRSGQLGQLEAVLVNPDAAARLDATASAQPTAAAPASVLEAPAAPQTPSLESVLGAPSTEG